MRRLRLIPGQTSYGFIARRKLAYVVSVVLLLVSAASLAVQGLNFGIDFIGGTLIEVRTKGPADLSAMRSTLGGLGLGEVGLQEFGRPDDVLIRVQRQPGGDEAQQGSVAKVKEALGDGVLEYRRVEVVAVLARACGPHGLVGGQAIDVSAAGRSLSRPRMEDMHVRKTGALIRAAVRLGALSALRRRTALAVRLDRYARCLGIAFQIRDDILDRHAETGTFGRPAGSDEAKNKPTWLSVAGPEEARRQALRMREAAVGALAGLGRDADPLRDLAEFAVARRS